jgi:TRAP-type C4-dicarboxylate transport system permease small subunit
MPWGAMFGLFLAARRQTMIRIDYFFEKLSPTIKRPVALFANAWCCIIFAYIGWYGLQYVFAFGSDTMPYLGFPKGLSTVALFFGGVAASLTFFRRILLKWKAR